MKKTYLHIPVLVIVGLISYSNSFSVPFQFDDYFNISANPVIKHLTNFVSSLSGYQYNPRRYLGYFSLALNYRYGGLDVTGYHIVNLLIHLINAILVYFLVSLTFKTPYFSCRGGVTPPLHTSITEHPSKFIALFSALLFVAHPIQTQAVTYIVQRFTSLATLFYLLAMVMYIKGRLVSNQADKPVSQQAGKLASYFFSLLSAVCAMKTKEIAFTLPLMILLFEFTFFRSTLKKRLFLLVPILLTLAVIPMTMMHTDKALGDLLSDLSEKTRVQTDISRGDYLMTEMRVIVTYIRLIFLPSDQNLDYDYPIYHSFFDPQVFLSFLFLSALFGTAVYLLYKSRRAIRQSSGQVVEWSNNYSTTQLLNYSTIHYSRLIAFGILWFFIALSVESSFIPIVDVIFEHRVYLPSVGAFIALTAGFFAATLKLDQRWPRSRNVVIPLVLIIVMSLSAATFARNRVWQDEVGLWKDVVRKSPGNARAHNNLGFLYNARNMNDQAVEQFLAATRLRPDYIDARINLGVAYNAKGMFALATEQFLIALSINPNDADAHNNFGITRVSEGLIDEGIKHYQTALSLQPDYVEAYNNLGVAYASKGLFGQARDNFEHAIGLKPDYFDATHNLALLYEKVGDYEKAADLRRTAKDMKTTSGP